MLGPTEKQVGDAIWAALSEPDGSLEPFDVMLARLIAEALGEPWTPKPEDPKNHLSGAAIERRVRGR